MTTFVQTTPLNVEIHGEVMNVYAKKASWRLTSSVSLTIPAWVWTVIQMLLVTQFVDVYVRMVFRATD